MNESKPPDLDDPRAQVWRCERCKHGGIVDDFGEPGARRCPSCGEEDDIFSCFELQNPNLRKPFEPEEERWVRSHSKE